jgi:hypothetical protein
VGLQERDPGRPVVVAGADELGEAAYVLDRHAGAAEPDDDVQQPEGELVEDAVVAAGPRQVAEQARPVVVAQGLDRQPGQPGRLAHGHPGGGIAAVHAAQPATRSALRVKPVRSDRRRPVVAGRSGGSSSA